MTYQVSLSSFRKAWNMALKEQALKEHAQYIDVKYQGFTHIYSEQDVTKLFRELKLDEIEQHLRNLQVKVNFDIIQTTWLDVSLLSIFCCREDKRISNKILGAPHKGAGCVTLSLIAILSLEPGINEMGCCIWFDASSRESFLKLWPSKHFDTLFEEKVTTLKWHEEDQVVC